MCKLTKDTIEEYFEINLSNRTGVSTVKLNKFKMGEVKTPPSPL